MSRLRNEPGGRPSGWAEMKLTSVPVNIVVCSGRPKVPSPKPMAWVVGVPPPKLTVNGSDAAEPTPPATPLRLNMLPAFAPVTGLSIRLKTTVVGDVGEMLVIVGSVEVQVSV